MLGATIGTTPLLHITIAPTGHEKNEWARFALDAADRGRVDIADRYRAASQLPPGARISLARFDVLQADYRAWLVFDRFNELTCGPCEFRGSRRADVVTR